MHENARSAAFRQEVALAVGYGVAQLFADGEYLPHHGVDQRLARVARADAADLVLVLDDVVEQLLQDLAALGEGGDAPARLRAAGALDFVDDGVAIEDGDVTQFLERGRVATLERGRQLGGIEGQPRVRFHRRGGYHSRGARGFVRRSVADVDLHGG